MSTKTEVEILPKIETDITEPDGMAHYVRIKALMHGGVVTALCGKRWVPETIAEAGDKKVCPTCAELYELLKMME